MGELAVGMRQRRDRMGSGTTAKLLSQPFRNFPGGNQMIPISLPGFNALAGYTQNPLAMLAADEA
jgi:hypothetical protein